MAQYESLQALLQDDPRAMEYFLALPEYVKCAALERARSINSLSSLQSLCDNFTQGDD